MIKIINNHYKRLHDILSSGGKVMKGIKKIVLSCMAFFIVCAMMVSGINAETMYHFVQNMDTQNGLGYVDKEVDQFESYSQVEKDGNGQYTSLSSKIYKPNSGDVLIVCFHGNGEGGVAGKCNNYSQLAGNQMAVKFISQDVQKSYGGAYVLAFQAPDYWYNDYTAQAKTIIDQAVDEFGIKEVFVTGLSAGGLMSERMLAEYGDYFSGALISCAAIAKNDQYVEGLGGIYTHDTDGSYIGEYFDQSLNLWKPADYNDYVTNYQGWLESIAKSNVPLYLVHCVKDGTISYTWSEMAYNYIKEYRENHDLDGNIYFQTIASTGVNKDTGSEMSGHWAWVKMYNNEIEVNGVSTMDWFIGLSHSTNTYEEKTYVLPSAGAADQENTFTYNLIAEVREDGEKVTAIEIDMNGAKVDAAQLSLDMFKVSAYNTDAQSELHSQINSGLFGSKDEPVTIALEKIAVNEKGNIVLTLKTKQAVLNWSGDLGRNLTTYMHYSIESTTLPLVVSQDNITTITNKEETSVQTGDQTSYISYTAMTLISLATYVLLKKKKA